MLNRLSVNAILKSVIATVAEASGYMFTALHNLRVDRSASFRDLETDKQFTAMASVLRAAREGEMLALKSAVVALDAIDFPERQAVVSSLDQSIKKLAALH